MAISCFFCQNLLSDFVEGILPASRHEELKEHLKTCPKCQALQSRLEKTLSLIKKQGEAPLFSDTLRTALQAAEGVSEVWLTRRKLSRAAPWAIAGVLLVATLIRVFPAAFPWLTYLRTAEEDSQFVRYFPLLQGAGDIIEEQSSWLTVKDPLSASLWEEGGMTPAEFEKTFTPKAAKP